MTSPPPLHTSIMRELNEKEREEEEHIINQHLNNINRNKTAISNSIITSNATSGINRNYIDDITYDNKILFNDDDIDIINNMDQNDIDILNDIINLRKYRKIINRQPKHFGLSTFGHLKIDYSCNWSNLDRYIGHS